MLMDTYFSWGLVVFWMGAIFYFSHQSAFESGRLSRRVTLFVVDLLKKAAPRVEVEEQKTHHIVRKNAHFFMYFVLGILLLNALQRSGAEGEWALLSAVFLSAVYAASDEFHQLFVPGRSGNVKDVFIDTAGSISGILLVWLTGWLR